jgi:hypothetical protein
VNVLPVTAGKGTAVPLIVESLTQLGYVLIVECYIQKGRGSNDYSNRVQEVH